MVFVLFIKIHTKESARDSHVGSVKLLLMTNVKKVEFKRYGYLAVLREDEPTWIF